MQIQVLRRSQHAAIPGKILPRLPHRTAGAFAPHQPRERAIQRRHDECPLAGPWAQELSRTQGQVDPQAARRRSPPAKWAVSSARSRSNPVRRRWAIASASDLLLSDQARLTQALAMATGSLLDLVRLGQAQMQRPDHLCSHLLQ